VIASVTTEQPETGLSSRSSGIETLESLRRAGHERLYPSITNPNWLVLRRRREIFKRWITQLEGRELSVLDLGGRIQPYRPLVESRLGRYFAVDLVINPLVSIVGRGEQIPVCSEEFDLVFCTQVLEYVADPVAVISEIHRILKPGGTLFLSVPAVFPRDSVEDKWRFLPGSLRVLVSGFSHSEIVAEGSSVSGFCRTFAVSMVTFTKPVMLQKILAVTAVPIVNLLAASLESLLRSSNDQLSANFSVLARK